MKNIVKTAEGAIHLMANPFGEYEDLYKCPCPSQSIGVSIASNSTSFQCYSLKEVKEKCVLTPLEKNSYACFGLMNTAHLNVQNLDQ